MACCMGGAKPARGAAKPSAAKGAGDTDVAPKDPALEMFRASLNIATGSRIGEPEGAYQQQGGALAGKKGAPPKAEGEAGPRESAAEAMQDRSLAREQPKPNTMFGGVVPTTASEGDVPDWKKKLAEQKKSKAAGQPASPPASGAIASAPGSADEVVPAPKDSFSPPPRGGDGTTTKWSFVGTKVNDEQRKSFYGGDAGKSSVHITPATGTTTSDEVAAASTTPVAAESSVGSPTEDPKDAKPVDAEQVAVEEEADPSLEETVEQVPAIRISTEEERLIEKVENTTAASKKRTLEELRKSSVVFEEEVVVGEAQAAAAAESAVGTTTAPAAAAAATEEQAAAGGAAAAVAEPASTASADAKEEKAAGKPKSAKRQKVEKAVAAADEKVRSSRQEAMQAEVNNKKLSAEEIQAMKMEEPVSALDSPRMVAQKKKNRKVPHPHHARPNFAAGTHNK
mmetsp:Transcript_10673/g.26135  ORF Transcript_10673/g.26135 Transcript_10673/m.26135 type:complete len:454 (-) Transcript_10673:751-2112(-)